MTDQKNTLQGIIQSCELLNKTKQLTESELKSMNYEFMIPFADKLFYTNGYILLGLSPKDKEGFYQVYQAYVRNDIKKVLEVGGEQNGKV